MCQSKWDNVFGGISFSRKISKYSISACCLLDCFLLIDPKSLISNSKNYLPCHRYAIYRNGKLDEEVTDVTDYWPKESVAFLIGCSFSYDGALLNAGIPLKSAQQGKNVPMYKTNLKCRPAGSLSGNMVVSMKPIPALKISKHVSFTISQPLFVLRTQSLCVRVSP